MTDKVYKSFPDMFSELSEEFRRTIHFFKTNENIDMEDEEREKLAKKWEEDFSYIQNELLYARDYHFGSPNTESNSPAKYHIQKLAHHVRITKSKVSKMSKSSK